MAVQTRQLIVLYQSFKPCPFKVQPQYSDAKAEKRSCNIVLRMYFFTRLIALYERSHVAELTGDVMASCIMSSKLGYC